MELVGDCGYFYCPYCHFDGESPEDFELDEMGVVTPAAKKPMGKVEEKVDWANEGW
jgi:hypothetical protein